MENQVHEEKYKSKEADKIKWLSSKDYAICLNILEKMRKNLKFFRNLASSKCMLTHTVFC